MTVLLWTALPYAAIASFVAGHGWRWRHDRWEAGRRAGRRVLGRGARWHVRLIHGGVVACLVDVVSLMIPRGDGRSADLLRVIGLTVGVAGASAMTAGLIILCARRPPTPDARRRRPSVMDWLTIGLLFTVLSFGLWEAIGINAVLLPHDNGLTIGRWLRDLLTFHPDADAMASATLDDRWHVATVVLLVALWPYTHLVHAWHGVAEIWSRPALSPQGDGHTAVRAKAPGVRAAAGGPSS